MTFITSSRKPAAEVRKMAKEIAFALDLAYVPRGKSGLRELGAGDPVIIFLSGARKGMIFDVTRDGEIVFSMLITKVMESERTEPFYHGFLIREPELYDALAPYVKAVFDEGITGPVVFCGTQKVRYALQVMV
jgi:U3 small nucleolar ribonucleoprotein protein IMP4